MYFFNKNFIFPKLNPWNRNLKILKMFPQTLVRNSVNNFSLLLNTCSRLPFVCSQRFFRSPKFPHQPQPIVSDEDDTLYKSIHIEARCGDRAVLDSYQKFVEMAAENLDIQLERS